MKHVLVNILMMALFCQVISITAFSQAFPDRMLSSMERARYSRSAEFPAASLLKDQDPAILQMISEINSDSITATLRALQNMGTRFLMLDSRKQVAEWLAARFVSFGYTDVVLDSFLCYVNFSNQYVDTLWQYNVVATLEGASAPSEEYVIGGHYDSYSQPDPYTVAPGVDDNGSAVATALEIARVMKKLNYQPETTIRFTLFAAEELGLYGSRYLAQAAREQGRDLRYVVNLDMIAYNPDSLSEVIIVKYPYFEWAASLAADIYERYTDLSVTIPVDYVFGGSDSYSYFLYGFPPIYIQECTFNLPNWHHNSDTVGTCNINYCTEVIKGACAVLMEEQLQPVPKYLTSTSSRQGVDLKWLGTHNANVLGYNIYRSEQPDTGFTRINTSMVTDTLFNDNTLAAGQQYYYSVKTAVAGDKESLPSDIVHGARFAFTDTLLVVSSLRENESTPDSIRQFYEYILDTIPFIWHDLTLSNPVLLGELARHRNILWVANAINYDIGLRPGYQDIRDFFENGGNMMISAFTPAKLMENVTTYPFQYPEGMIMHDYFKIDSVNRKLGSIMDLAYPDAAGYDTLNADTLKALAAGYPGQLFNIEVYVPLPEGTVTYRFNSPYPPGSSQGLMQDKPVGIEFLGSVYKTFLLSFPLYYIDTSDAKRILQDVIRNRFTFPEPVAEHPATLAGAIRVYPNPVRDHMTIVYEIRERAETELSIYNMSGEKVAVLAMGTRTKGIHQVTFNPGQLPSGIYNLVLRTPNSVYSQKFVRTR